MELASTSGHIVLDGLVADCWWIKKGWLGLQPGGYSPGHRHLI